MSYKKAEKKKFIKFLLCAVAILIAAVIVMPFFSKEEAYRMITVFEVSGTVGVVKDGIEYEAYPGMHLQEGHVIVTSEDSYARLVLDDDKYVKVEAGSRLEFETLGLLGTKKTRLKLDRGAITSEIVNPLGADEEYVVNTPNAVLAVRGTFFRVDLRVTKNGEIDTNVYTYGGKVASNRIMPTGEKVEEEVIVDAGYMTAIRMDTLETIYIVGMAETPSGQPVEETQKNTIPIEPAAIPDDDLVDMYFASENGHEMFLSTDEIKESIEVREISLEEKLSVYEKSDEVKTQLQEENTTETNTNTVLIPDDRGDVEEETEVAVEDTDEPQIEDVVPEPEPVDVVVEVEEEIVPEEVVQETPEQVVVVTPAPVVPPASTEEPETEVPHSHSYTSQITTPATCTDAGVKTYSCTCGDSYTEEITALGHSETTEYIDGTASADGLRRVYCENCDETYEEETLFSIPLHFPDEAFAQYVRNTYNNDSYTNSLSEEEFASLEAATNVTLQGTVDQDGGVASLEGIEYFTNLSSLNCSYNTSLATLDLSMNPKLVVLDVSDTSIDSLALGANQEIEELNISRTKISDLNTLGLVKLNSVRVDGCESLRYLSLDGCTELTSIDTAGCPNLVSLDISDTGITYLNVSANMNLTNLYLQNTGVSMFDLAHNFSLQTLDCSGSAITSFPLIGSTQLQSVNVSNCTQLMGLSLTDKPSLQYITANNCPSLTSFDASGSTSLIKLELNGSGITTLDVSDATSLSTLYIENCTALQSLTISNTSLTSLDCSTCSGLKTFIAENCTRMRNDGISYPGATTNAIETIVISNMLPDTTLSFSFMQCKQLKTLQLTNCDTVEYLNMEYIGNIESLTIENCPKLRIVSMEGNPLVSNITLAGDMSGLKALNLKNTAITTLSLDSTIVPNLEELNVSGCTSLTNLTAQNLSLAYVEAEGCPFTSFDVSGNVYKSIVTSATVETDLSNMTLGFDPDKVSDVQGAVFDPTTRKFTNIEGNTFTYKYQCTSTNQELFTVSIVRY